MLKDHNAVTPVRLEPAASRSRVKHSTTEPLPSLEGCMSQGLGIYIHLYCLAVEAGFYSDVVVCLPVIQQPGFNSRLEQEKKFRL